MNMVKIGQPTYHRKRKYFTIPATGDKIHEINLDYISYPLIPVATPNTKRG